MDKDIKGYAIKAFYGLFFKQRSMFNQFAEKVERDKLFEGFKILY